MSSSLLKIPFSLLGYRVVGISPQRDCLLFRKSTPAAQQILLVEQFLVSRYLHGVFVDQQINCVLDVGANRGQFARSLRSSGYAGHILSFEPVPEMYEHLTRLAESDPCWRVFSFALGSKNHTMTLNLTNSSVLTSFLPPSEYGKQSMGEGTNIYNTVEVNVKRLDSVLDEVTKGLVSPRLFLKMDTQGFDLEVLAGAGTRIGEFLGLQSEVSVIPLYDGMPGMGQSISMFREAGFEMVGMMPVVRDRGHAGVIEFDCIMSRPKRLATD